MKPLLLISAISYLATFNCNAYSNLVKKYNLTNSSDKLEVEYLKEKVLSAKDFIANHHFNTEVCFIIDMRLHSGKKRFFIYDLTKDSVLDAGLVAHGSCNYYYLSKARFSNEKGCGCSSIGKYKIGKLYQGRFGKAFKLYGLDSTNSNAFKRNIVLHAYSCVSDTETYPERICNSLGCPMVSYKFLNKAAAIIEQSKSPLLLWMIN